MKKNIKKSYFTLIDGKITGVLQESIITQPLKRKKGYAELSITAHVGTGKPEIEIPNELYDEINDRNTKISYLDFRIRNGRPERVDKD